MKKLLFTIVATFLFAFTSLAAGKPEMEFKVTSHDFGYIDEYGGNVSYEFEFTNTGDKPLMGAHLSAEDGKVKLNTI